MGAGNSDLGCCYREDEATRAERVEEFVCPSGKCLADHQGLVAVQVPDSVTGIADKAFCECKALQSIVIPPSVTSIGEGAFRGCSSLAKVSIPETVTAIGSGAFSGCVNLTSINLPSTLEAIRDETFSGCRQLGFVKMPQKLKSIGNWAFFSCTSLVDVDLPPDLESIGRCAFYSCSELTSAEVPRSIKTIQRGTFAFCCSLRYIQLPNSVDSIGAWAFRDCKSLVIVKIPGSVTTIGHQAFAWCSALRSVRIPPSVTSIGAGAFASCASLSNVDLPESVSSIGDEAFVWCAALAYVRIPSSVDTIGDDAFFGCSTQCAVSVPDSVSRVGQRAFPPGASLTTRDCGGQRCASPPRRGVSPMRQRFSPGSMQKLDRQASGAVETGRSSVSCSTACTEADLSRSGRREEESIQSLERASREIRREMERGAAEEWTFDGSSKVLEQLRRDEVLQKKEQKAEEKAVWSSSSQKSEEKTISAILSQTSQEKAACASPSQNSEEKAVCAKLWQKSEDGGAAGVGGQPPAWEAQRRSPEAASRGSPLQSPRSAQAACAEVLKKSEDFRREMEVAKMMRADYEAQHLRHLLQLRALDDERDRLELQLGQQAALRSQLPSGRSHTTSTTVTPRLHHSVSAPGTPASARRQVQPELSSYQGLRRDNRGLLVAPPVYVRPSVPARTSPGALAQPTAVG